MQRVKSKGYIIKEELYKKIVKCESKPGWYFIPIVNKTRLLTDDDRGDIEKAILARKNKDTICCEFNISKHNLRNSIKKWFGEKATMRSVFLELGGTYKYTKRKANSGPQHVNNYELSPELKRQLQQDIKRDEDKIKEYANNLHL